jgi:hypothetical protein
MKKLFIVGSFIVCALGFRTVSNVAIDPIETRAAAEKSLRLLEKSSHTFLINAGGCHSCHGQGLGGISFSLAREKNLKLNDSTYQELIDSIQATWQQRTFYITQHEDPAAIIIGGGYDLWTIDATKTKHTKNLELLAKNIMVRQHTDGNWSTKYQRPPLESYAFTATALSIKNIQSFLPAVYATEVKDRVLRAQQWLLQTPAIANEERCFQLLGLLWSNAGDKSMKPFADALLQTQQQDGGWAQLPTLKSDAYATGQALYALYKSGHVKVTSAEFQRGIQFLLKTQLPDGSWEVQSRSVPVVPFVESGFPHAGNQFISAAGTNWALIALLL